MAAARVNILVTGLTKRKVNYKKETKKKKRKKQRGRKRERVKFCKGERGETSGIHVAWINPAFILAGRYQRGENARRISLRRSNAGPWCLRDEIETRERRRVTSKDAMETSFLLLCNEVQGEFIFLFIFFLPLPVETCTSNGEREKQD